MKSKIESILVWPRSVCLGWADECENKSTDTHHSESAARAVCRTLIAEGFGCNYEIFPVEARVEVNGEVVYRWTESEGETINTIKEKRSGLSAGWITHDDYPACPIQREFTIEFPKLETLPLYNVKQSAYERANPNQPWYARYRKNNK